VAASCFENASLRDAPQHEAGESAQDYKDQSALIPAAFTTLPTSRFLPPSAWRSRRWSPAAPRRAVSASFAFIAASLNAACTACSGSRRSPRACPAARRCRSRRSLHSPAPLRQSPAPPQRRRTLRRGHRDGAELATSYGVDRTRGHRFEHHLRFAGDHRLQRRSAATIMHDVKREPGHLLNSSPVTCGELPTAGRSHLDRGWHWPWRKQEFRRGLRPAPTDAPPSPALRGDAGDRHDVAQEVERQVG